MRFYFDMPEKQKLPNQSANVKKTQLFQKNFPKFLNSSVSPGPSSSDYSVLLFGLARQKASRVKGACLAAASGFLIQDYTDPSLKDTPVKTELFRNFDKFFWKSWVFMPLALPFGNFPFSGMSKQKRMQSGVSVYRLYEGQKYANRWHTWPKKIGFSEKKTRFFFWQFSLLRHVKTKAHTKRRVRL